MIRAVAVLLLLAGPLSADVYTRVVDVGAGLCCVVALPDNRFMIYDAGRGSTREMAAIQDIIPSGSEIDLLVLSHSDGDHLGAVAKICERYKVKHVLHDGVERDTDVWEKATKAIASEVAVDGCIDTNLKHVPVVPGETFDLGEATATFVCGFHELPEDWPISGDSEVHNAGSIVIRLDYEGQSILFTGDTVGRHINDPDDVCIAAEKFMVDNAANVSIDSDVIIAPHHGADNGSSTAFIEAVSPKFVIFSAGNLFDHPRQTTADRYLAAGVVEQNMFRTDRGSDKGGLEWVSEDSGEGDSAGDDDVEILLTEAGNVHVRYRQQLFFALDGPEAPIFTPDPPVQPLQVLEPIQPVRPRVSCPPRRVYCVPRVRWRCRPLFSRRF